MNRGYFVMMIGVLVFFSGIIFIQITASSSGIDYLFNLVTIGLTVSGLAIIGGSIMYLRFGKKS